jgi:hypothetical protein
MSAKRKEREGGRARVEGERWSARLGSRRSYICKPADRVSETTNSRITVLERFPTRSSKRFPGRYDDVTACVVAFVFTFRCCSLCVY